MSQTDTGVLRRISEQLVAPRASRGELLVVYAAALAGVTIADQAAPRAPASGEAEP